LIVVRPYDDQPTHEFRRHGARVITQPDLRWKRCDIKSTNLLANVLAIEAAHRAGCDEAVLIDSNGLVTEATHSSVLWVRNGRLEGTPEGHEILSGMTRQLILRLAHSLEIPFGSSHVTVAELREASEVILVGTTSEVLPVVRIDHQTVGAGSPGPIARRLSDAYRREVEKWLAPQPPTA
jgi:D-alanine transaminase